MEYYNLREDESVLYIGEAYKIKQVILTNLNLITVIVKKPYSKKSPLIDIYPVDKIKIYKDVPQIKTNDCTAEIYLTTKELKLTFFSKGELNKFVNAAFELITGKDAFSRNTDKVKNAVDAVDNSLGINTIETVKNVVENGVSGSLLGFLGKKAYGLSKKSSSGQMVLNATKQMIDSESSVTKTSEPDEFDDNIEKLKKLKKLLDADIITQEEYEQKKLELLNSI